LVALTVASLLVPLLSKRQPYCHHICPFGAAQQLLHAATPWRLRLPATARRLLALVPPTLLLLVLLTALLHWPIDLAGIEPFDAFVFWIAGTATLALAVVGLVAALFVPLAYCRYGCPTGAMLDYLRFHARSDQVTRRDLFALGLLLLALALR
jgi:polyferredoxin